MEELPLLLTLRAILPRHSEPYRTVHAVRHECINYNGRSHALGRYAVSLGGSFATFRRVVWLSS